MTYRKKIEKIFKKLESLAQRGDDAIFDFKEYINEIVDGGEYSIFDDVMLTKYSIDIKKYKSVDELKKNIFPQIKSQTKPKFAKNLENLQKSKSVYSIGYHFYDEITKKYLGDIIETEDSVESKYTYIDKKLASKIGLYAQPKLEVIVGLSSSIYEALPEFDDKYFYGILTYPIGTQVTYNDQVFECVKSFTWSFGKQITPTYSEYWTFSSFPTYSVNYLTEAQLSLLEKYDQAIDKLRDLN